MGFPVNQQVNAAKTATDWVVDRLLRGMIGSVKTLPYPRRVAAMGKILSHGIGPLAGYRRRAIENLTLIYPKMSDEKKRQIAVAVCDNFGRTLIENYSYQDLSLRLEKTAPSGSGINHVLKAKTDGQPIVFVTGHFGNHEAPRHVLTRMGLTIGGLYRPMGNPFFNAHYSETMTSWGGPVFAQGPETRGFARHIKNGGMGTLLSDVSVANGSQVRFLGRQARTATSAADIALKFDALLVPYYGIRKEDGLSFDVIVEDPISHTDAITMTTAATESLGRRVARNPEQWFWVHRRWK